MKRSEKFRQADREALATVAATAVIIVFWYLAGFGLADVPVKIFHTPLWFWTGVVGTWLFATLLVIVLTKCVFTDKDEEKKEARS